MLSKTVPPLVPTIVFLSGGFSDSDIMSYLNSINKVKQANPNRAPWALVSLPLHDLKKKGSLVN